MKSACGKNAEINKNRRETTKKRDVGSTTENTGKELAVLIAKNNAVNVLVKQAVPKERERRRRKKLY